jgi:hypothetical protein
VDSELAGDHHKATPDISKISEGYLRVVQAQISAGYLPGIFAIGSLAQILLGGINLIPHRYQRDICGISSWYLEDIRWVSTPFAQS